jgi:hypothetical protein
MGERGVARGVCKGCRPLGNAPRHTPKIGTLPANALMTSFEIPASDGLPGPGEIITRSGFSPTQCATST